MISLYIQLGAFLIVALFFAVRYILQRRPRLTSSPQLEAKIVPSERSKASAQKNAEEIALLKELYYKLQHLEDYPEVLPGAWKLLRSLTDQAVLLGKYKATTSRSILGIEKFDHAKVREFVALQFEDTMTEWEAYVDRRKAGGPRESFPKLEDAHNWLKNLSPLNMIDGAWLCRLHKVTTPFALRRVTKDAWQTYSEEMGDGDLEKNHVFIWRKLLQDIKAGLPASDDPDFTHPRHNIDDLSWRGATAHLLVSLFPNDFLPEILGFNLHFEALTTGTLRAMKELEDFKISAEYFTLHIGIDNADSGHTAMALATVARYMDLVQNTGIMDPSEAWTRIQAGYLLSQNADSDITVDSYEMKVAEMLQKKASLARKIHCTSRVRIGKRSLSQWFTSDWRGGKVQTSDNGKEGEDWKEEFLAALADARPWVHRGNSSKSLLMRELAWKGRMFGAFTENEVELLRTWIDSLKVGDGGVDEPYLAPVEEFESKPPFLASRQDAATWHPALPPQIEIPASDKYSHVFAARASIQAAEARLDVVLPLWFTHLCLLENMVNSPHQMANLLESRILQILRIDYAYKPDAQGVAGMDEHTMTATPDLIALGLAIVRNHNLPEPATLGDVLASPSAAPEAVAFAYAMLGWAMRPKANAMFLVGLARAFHDFELWVVNREDVLPKKERAILNEMIGRKSMCYAACLHGLWEGETYSQVQRQSVVCGYEYGRDEIEKLLSGPTNITMA